MKVGQAGPWKVQAGKVVTPDGVTPVTVISDGVTEFVSAADPAELLVALMVHLEIETVGPS